MPGQPFWVTDSVLHKVSMLEVSLAVSAVETGVILPTQWALRRYCFRPGTQQGAFTHFHNGKKRDEKTNTAVLSGLAESC